MPILKVFTKQPVDVQDYDITCEAWLTALGDTPLSVTATAPAGITQPIAATVTNGIVKVWAAGGTDLADYKYTITLVTVGGRTKQFEIKLKVREV